MKYDNYNKIYEIPKRLSKKQSFFGTIQATDVICIFILAAIGLLSMALVGGLVGLAMLLVCALTAFFVFIYTDKYEENYRVQIGRKLEFKKRQNYFIYRRGTK